MKKILLILYILSICFSCNDEIENDGYINNRGFYLDEEQLIKERNKTNLSFYTLIRMVNDSSIVENNNVLEKSIHYKTDDFTSNISKLFLNEVEHTKTDTKSFIYSEEIINSNLKFNDINKIKLVTSDTINNLDFLIEDPVKFINLSKDGLISKNKNLYLEWKNNESSYARLNILSSNLAINEFIQSWLIPNTGKIGISSKFLKTLKNGTYNFTIERFDFIPLEIEEGKNCLIEFESSHSIAVKIE